MRRLWHVVAFAVQSRDGYIARYPGQSTLDWRSGADAEFFTSHLNSLEGKGVIVVGNNTYKLVEERLSKRNCIVFTRSVQSRRRQGARLLYCNPDVTSLEPLLRNYRTVVLLGGTQTYTFFWERDLIDELYITVEPVLFGGGLPLFNSRESVDRRLRLVSTKPLNQQKTILQHYQRRLTQAHI